MNERIFIDGENIYLRILTKEDINGNYIHWFDDAATNEMNSHHRFPYSTDYMGNYIDSINNSREHLVLAIIDKLNHKHIGNVSLQNINYINRSAEFAIIIGEKDYRGKKISKKSAELIIRHGFLQLNLNRIYCGTPEKNNAMIGIALSMNFIKEGVRRKEFFKNGEYLDVIEFGILKDEWLKYEQSL